MSPVDRLRRAPRCTATSKRTKQPCMGPAVKGWPVCRFHGARGGAPSGPSNGSYRSGLHTKEAIKERRHVRGLLKAAKALTSHMAGEPL